VNANDYPGRGLSTAALGCGQGEAPAPDAADGSDGLFWNNSGGLTVQRANQDADAPNCRTETAPRPRRQDRSADRHDSRPRAVGYCRVSTDAQATDGVSLDAQRARIAAWADANGYCLADVFTDAGLSGKRADNRPGLQAALADVCRSGGALVVYSLSRLARSTRDAIAIAERLDKDGADMVSLTEKIDTTTAAGKMVFRLLAVLNEFERDLASERTRAALAHKRTRNERTGGVPFGWRLVDPTARKKDALLVEAPDEQAVLARIREWHAAGDTLRDIAAKLTAEGVPTKQGNATWTHQAVGKIMARMERSAMA
jgi:site-specific DNA recombinase